jgi:prepilin-type N-terminal cleavage/methylation domain-containing protein
MRCIPDPVEKEINWQGGTQNLSQAKPTQKQLNLNKLSDAGGSQMLWLSDAAKNLLFNRIRCKAARHPFSLIEIMIVLVLVGVLAGVSTFSLRPLYQSYRFGLEVEALYELLQELQIEALTLQSDMKVGFTKEKGKLIAKSSCDETILKSQTLDLSHIEQIDPIDVIFIYSNGLIRPTSLIKLSAKQNERWLDLRGGHLIKLLEKAPQETGPIKIPDLNEIKKSIRS